MAYLARAAGFAHARVEFLEVDSGLESPAEIVEWRWGMAHLATFVAGMPDEARERARAQAEAAVASMLPVVISMMVLSAT